MTKKSNDFRQMTADTVGKDLLGALVQEIRLLPDVWPKLPKKKQDDVIDRLRKRVEENVNMAVFTLAAQDRTVVAGSLDQITIKDGVKAVIKFSIKSPNLDGLYEAASDGSDVLVVVAGVKEHTGGMNEIQGEDDQRGMDLGHEYNENDGGGMNEPIEGKVIGLPEKVITEEDLETAYQDGRLAAEEGNEQADCPIMDGSLVAKWVRGFKDWHEENPVNDETESSDDKDAA
ncbi:Rmf/CrpP family protein [Nitrosomonas ureae]|uniref:Cell division protein FtsK n=1 Tax=Nitrosomonas ureae TaxID=44577 RepID=A0A1H2ERF7_9PROT|nr:Rmf/CrpP family protein [Nitrosomonas ureae]ALQ51871.1 cell division protein FtsK [Nitrosomonas ureae]SDT97318.1 hypothetical protein SAMN05216406_11476 [Nitrosomonas ureae]